MNVLRKMLVILLAGLLSLFLFTLAIDASIIKVAGSSGSIKQTLASSGIYDSIIPAALDQAKTSGGDQGGGTPLTDQTVKTVAEKTFTPQFLQQNTENVLDSIFIWLDGKTQVPNFRIDLTPLKSTFAAELAKAAQTRAATLPACPPGLSGNSDNFDPFSATCLPKNTSPAQVAAEVNNNVASAQGFLENPVITAETLKASGHSQSVFADELKQLPSNYQRFKKSPFVLGLLSLLLALGIIFTSISRRKGLRRVGLVLASAGIFIMLLAWGISYGINKQVLPKLNLDNKVFEGKIRNLVTDITHSVDKTYYIFGGTYIALGALAIAGSIFIHKNRSEGPHPEHLAVSAPPAEFAEPEAPAAAQPKPQPKKKTHKKILIQ